MNEVRLIDANALKEEMELSKYIIPNDINRLLNSEINRCIEAIDNAPTVAVNCKDCDGYEAGYSAGLKDAEIPQGEWGKHGECPFCSYIRQWEDDKFCGNCGADMRTKENNNV